MTLHTEPETAALIRALREIVWSEERVAGDETGELANQALRDFARANPHVLNEFDFLELREYLEAQPDDGAKAILAKAEGQS